MIDELFFQVAKLYGSRKVGHAIDSISAKHLGEQLSDIVKEHISDLAATMDLWMYSLLSEKKIIDRIYNLYNDINKFLGLSLPEQLIEKVSKRNYDCELCPYLDFEVMWKVLLKLKKDKTELRSKCERLIQEVTNRYLSMLKEIAEIAEEGNEKAFNFLLGHDFNHEQSNKIKKEMLMRVMNFDFDGLYYALDEFDEKNKGDLATWKHKADDDEQFLIDYNYKLGTFYKERMKICNDYYLRQLKACLVKDEHQRNRLSSIISSCVDRSLAIDYFKKAIQLGKECKIDKSDVISNSCWELADRDLFPNLGVKEERSFLMAAMASSIVHVRDNAKNKYNNITTTFLKTCNDPQSGTSFSDIAYHERQFIYIAKDVDALAGCYDDCIQWLFTIDALPKELHFPVGHPLPNSLYYAHPAKKGEYLPIENAEEELCNDKVRDFQRLVQCLGATDIKYRLVKGQSLSDKYSGNTNVEAGADYKVFKGNAEYNGQRSGSRDESMNGQHEIVLHFNPNKAPYIPDDIKGWLSVDPDWESLRKQRFEGNMLEYRVRISSRKTMAVSESRMDEVKVAFKSFIAKAHVNFSQQMERSFQREEETEWEYYVKFKPLNELGANFTKDEPKKTDTEQQYLDTLCEFMEDDSEITPRERKMLDRIRQSLGISEERAMELEASLAKPQLTEDEQEYLEMFHEYVKKGEITAKERRKLEMSANAMGISQSRVQELEKL